MNKVYDYSGSFMVVEKFCCYMKVLQQYAFKEAPYCFLIARDLLVCELHKLKAHAGFITS